MIETIVQFINLHPDSTHWIAFAALIIAGFNIPINEELVIISTALIAANIIPENSVQLYLTLIFGCIIADTIAYWIGRLFGNKIWNFPILRKLRREKIVSFVESHYHKHGLLTLMIGRCIPLGVRNCVFFTAGLGKMYYLKFVLTDAAACLMYVSTLFFLTFNLSENSDLLFSHLKVFNITLLIIILFTIGIAWYYYKKKKC